MHNGWRSNRFTVQLSNGADDVELLCRREDGCLHFTVIAVVRSFWSSCVPKSATVPKMFSGVIYYTSLAGRRLCIHWGVFLVCQLRRQKLRYYLMASDVKTWTRRRTNTYKNSRTVDRRVAVILEDTPCRQTTPPETTPYRKYPQR